MTEQVQDAHDLMLAGLVADIPRLHDTDDTEDPIAHVKWFTPDSSWTWFVTEYDPIERIGFGLVHGHERELGYFSLTEIEQTRGPLGLRVERDLYWKSKPLSQCK